jgi:5-methylcytosine-specific restriction endonuclease McrA
MKHATADMREYKRLWAAARRADYMAGKSCVVCGTTESLEVDHIDPAEKVSHRIWTWAIPRRDAELAKCQILCTEHHLEKTIAQRPIPEHGTVSRYTSKKHKCRCEPCRSANRERCALNRAKQVERELIEFQADYKSAA